MDTRRLRKYSAILAHHETLGMSPSLFLYLSLSKSYFRLGTLPSSHLELIRLLLLLLTLDPLRRSSWPPRRLDLSPPRRLWSAGSFLSSFSTNELRLTWPGGS